MLRLFVAVVVLGALWLHWRAAYTSRVRAALDDLTAASERLDDLVEDLRDKRLAYRCKAAIRAYNAGDADEAGAISALGLDVLSADTLAGGDGRVALAQAVLELI